MSSLEIVDVSEVNKASADELLAAATTQGFLFVEGHGFTPEEVKLMFDISRSFFDLPKDYKRKQRIDGSNRGYSEIGQESLDAKLGKGDPKEAYNIDGSTISLEVLEKILPDWFAEDPQRLHHTHDIMLRLYVLSIKILRLLALGLEIEDSETEKGVDWFVSKYKADSPSGTALRLLHYPGQKSLNPEAVIRAGAHTDYGSMTLLFQQENQEGLEIYLPVLKTWEAVPYVRSRKESEAAPLVVNIADQLSYWTGGLLRSTIHRVKFPPKVQESGQDRYLVVFFSHPSDDTLLVPVPSEKVCSAGGRGANKAERILTAGEHLQNRVKASRPKT